MATSLSEVRYYQDEGVSVLDISGLTGMSRPLIYYWLNRWGLKPNINRRPNLTASQRRRVAKLHDKGLSQADIAQLMDVPKHQVRYSIERNQ
jgi:transposase